MAQAKTRIDLLLVERGLAPSRERAQAYILAGRVLVSEQKILKPGVSVAADAPIRLLGDDPPYVSRGGLKLARALEHWQIPVIGRACIDVGTSTGGFTDCLLQHGAASVTCIDTGFGQIAAKLRTDTRVHLMERTNARLLAPNSVTAEPVPTLLVAEAVILVKPQFEAGREHIGKGGIVRDPEAHQLTIDRVADGVRSVGWQVVETIPSPITGAEGNHEFLLYARRPASA